ncbi:hypothetical protein RN001_008593 [Aquatica leii]|uniref:Uncharacterized protein n=1 Tax=Aquatica leii TaxID=1421715 RepID=A0AAN7PZA0_9COLE|nr:hypothetical protein RN001_008593 [Aquatica leii]
MEIVYAILLVGMPIIAALPQYQRTNTNYDSPSATILRHENNNIGIGNYEFAYQTSDGISREEKAELKTIGSNKAVVVRGSYSYVGSDGQTYTVNYVADENGYLENYVPEGDLTENLNENNSDVEISDMNESSDLSDSDGELPETSDEADEGQVVKPLKTVNFNLMTSEQGIVKVDKNVQIEESVVSKTFTKDELSKDVTERRYSK